MSSADSCRHNGDVAGSDCVAIGQLSVAVSSTSLVTADDSCGHEARSAGDVSDSSWRTTVDGTCQQECELDSGQCSVQPRTDGLSALDDMIAVELPAVVDKDETYCTQLDGDQQHCVYDGQRQLSSSMSSSCDSVTQVVCSRDINAIQSSASSYVAAVAKDLVNGSIVGDAVIGSDDDLATETVLTLPCNDDRPAPLSETCDVVASECIATDKLLRSESQLVASNNCCASTSFKACPSRNLAEVTAECPPEASVQSPVNRNGASGLRLNENTSASHDSGMVVDPLCLTSSSADNAKLFGGDERSGWVGTAAIVNNSSDSQLVSTEPVKYPHTPDIGSWTSVVGLRESTTVEEGSGDAHKITSVMSKHGSSDDAVVVSVTVTDATKSVEKLNPRGDECALTPEAQDGISSVSCRAVGSNQLSLSSAGRIDVEPHMQAAVVLQPHTEASTTTNKCLSASVSGVHHSVAQSSNATTAATACAGYSPSNSDTVLCSRLSYVPTLSQAIQPVIPTPSLSTQPLKSLADLVHKVSISASGASSGTELSDHVLKKNVPSTSNTELGYDAALYSDRLGYTAECPPGRSGNNAYTTANISALSEVEKASSYGRKTDEMSPIECRGPVTGCDRNSSSLAVADRIENNTADVHDVLPAVNSLNSLADASPGGKLARGASFCKARKSRKKSNVTKCKVDAVDVKFLTDLIVACSGDGIVTENRIVKKSATTVTDISPPVDSKCHEDVPCHQTAMQCETVEPKPRAKQPKPRKGNALQKKTTKLLSDITLIDVAAVKSCVEKDYLEFIKSIQQTAVSNALTLSDSKSTKKKKRTKVTSENIETLTANVEVKGKRQRWRSKVKGSKVKKKNNISVSEQHVKRRTSKKKQNPSPGDPIVLIDKYQELPVTNTVISDGVQCPVTEATVSTLAPNCSVPPSTKKTHQKKKRTSLSGVKSELNRMETHSHRKATSSKTATQESMLQSSIQADVPDMLSEGDRTVLNGDGDVTLEHGTKKCRSRKKKPRGALEPCAGAAGDGLVHQNSSCSGRKRKSHHVASETVSLTECNSAALSDNTPVLTTDAVVDQVCQSLAGVAQNKQTEAQEGVVAKRKKGQRKSKKKTVCLMEAKLPASETIANAVAPTGLVPDVESSRKELEVPLVNESTVGSSLIQSVSSDQTRGVEQTPQCVSVLDPTGLVSAAAEDAVKGEDVDSETKVFACAQCSYRARKKGQLRKHLSVHKQFSCAHCEFSTDTQTGLDGHMAGKHPSRCGRRLCKRCHMLFRAGQAFVDHVEHCTGVKLTWQCSTCGKNFKFISAMRTHMRRWHGTGDSVTASNTLNVSSLDATDASVNLSSTEIVVESDVPEPAVRPEPIVAADAFFASNSPTSTSVPVSLNSTAEGDSVLPVSLTLSNDSTSPGKPEGFDVMMNTSGHTKPEPAVDQSSIEPAPHTSQPSPVSGSVGDGTNKPAAATVDGEQRYVCDHCPKSFKAKRSMVHHRRMVHEGGRLQKRTAAASVTDAEKISKTDDETGPAAERLPVDDADGTESLQPTDGGAEIKLPSSSAAAIRVVHSCSFAGCLQTFKRQDQLIRHEERKHAGPDIRKFACDWPDCRKSFLHEDNLVSHRRQHTEPKPFRCELCPLGYWQKSSLRSHRLKAHRPATTVGSSSVVSEADANQLVDGIIKSVTASLRDAGSRLPVAEASSVAELSELHEPPTSVGLTVLTHGVAPSHGMADEMDGQQDQASDESEWMSGEDVTQRVANIIATNSVAAEVVDTQPSEEAPVVTAHEIVLSPEPLTNQAIVHKQPETINVYEFCEDEAVSICRPKPPRASVAAPRTSSDVQSTYSGNAVPDNDEDDDDLMAFDDDLTPTVDRLAETVITYSRKKKPTPDGKPDVGSSKVPSRSVKSATKKSGRQNRPVAGQRRKRTRTTEIEQVLEEPVKKKARRSKTVASHDDDDDSSSGLQRGQPRPAAAARNKKKSRNDKASDGYDGNRSKRSLFDEVSANVSPNQSSADDAVTRRKKSEKDRRSRKSSERRKTAKAGAKNVDVQDDGLERVCCEDAVVSTEVPVGERPRAKKVKGVKGRKTRATARQIILKDDAVDDVKENESNVELTEPQHLIHVESTDDNQLPDPIPVNGVTEHNDAGPAAALDCLSDNTEILSLNENADDDDGDRDGDADGDDGIGQFTRRSSPASYKSEEHEPRATLTADDQHAEDSRGSLLEESEQVDQCHVAATTSDTAAGSPVYARSPDPMSDAGMMYGATDVVTPSAASKNPVSVSYGDATLAVTSAPLDISHSETTFSPVAVDSLHDYQSTVHVTPTTSFHESSSAVDDMRLFYQQDDCQRTSPPRHTSMAEPQSASRPGFSYAADGLSGTYALLPRAEGPLQSLEGLAADGASYMAGSVASSGYFAGALWSTPVDSTPSYSMSLPPYPSAEVDQSKMADRVPTYLPYGAQTAVNTPQSTESATTLYGRSVPHPPAFPSDAFTKDFFGQYLHDSSLHSRPTHDPHAAGILGGYQQSATLPTVPHGGSGSELFRRAYSGVSDSIFAGMKSPSQTPLGVSQAQHWMDTPRRWNQTPPAMHSDVSRYTYPPGRTELADQSKTQLPAPAPMSSRPDEFPTVFASSNICTTASLHYPLSGNVYSPTAPAPYPHPSLPSAGRQLEDAYRQMAAAGDYRSLAHHRTPSEMYGSALSSLDRYYYTARDAMYRSQQLAAAAMPNPFMPQTSISSQYGDRSSGYGRESLPAYGQCPAPAYGFIGTNRQYLPPSSASSVRPGDYTSSQDSYSRHSVIYNVMPRYF